jgi:hypothetical protein
VDSLEAEDKRVSKLRRYYSWKLKLISLSIFAPIYYFLFVITMSTFWNVVVLLAFLIITIIVTDYIDTKAKRKFPYQINP